MQIPEQTINEVRDRADIVEVVSRFVELRRAGTNYKALCPFHEEKTPSFVVSPDRQIFHCFGCGQGGNVFTFLMEMEGVSFPEAVRELGKQYGVEVVARAKAPAETSHNDILYRIHDFAARWYHRRLLAREGERVREYLLERSIPEAAWAGFQLGYAGERGDEFSAAARRKNIPVDALREVKLIVASDRSSGYYDYFRRRLMFPILLPSGRTVAFGGRCLEPDVEPKYLNSVESAIYAKRRVLYGMPQAREAIRTERCAILVEGYMDCIALHVNGLRHAVASCGTAITSDHATSLRRVTRRVILIPDGDAAGRDAAVSAGAVLLSAGLDVAVVRLERDTDPDDAVRSLGGEEFRKKTAGGMAYWQYLDYIMKDRARSPREKETLIQRVTAGFFGCADALRHEMLTQELARVVGVDAESLRRRKGQPAGGRKRLAGGEGEGGVRARLEKTLLRLLLEATSEAAAARERLDEDDFSHGRCRALYKLLDSAWENHIDIGSGAFQQLAEKAGLEGFAAEISLISIPPGKPGILLRDAVRRVKELQIRDELDALREKLQELPEESEDAVAVAEHYARLKRALSEL